MRTAEDTALLLAVLFKKSGQKRARISQTTIRRLSQRSYLRAAFINRLLGCIDDLGLTMTELARGGYGMIPSSALEGAPPITAKKYLADVLERLEKGKIEIEDLRAQVEEAATEESDDA